MTNPLSKFYRAPALYTGLPSGTTYYSPDQVEFTESGEIAVYPMTLSDELLLKNPDALLNGEAIATVITNCVPSIKKPKDLLSNDIDAIMVALRLASFGDKLDIEAECRNPECKHNNKFEADLKTLLYTAKKLPEQSVVNLKSGLSVFLKPHTYGLSIASFKVEFEAKKAIKALSNITDEDEKVSKFSQSFSKIAELQVDMLIKSIIKIVKEDEGLIVTEQAHIRDFIKNVDTKTIGLISEKLEEINKIGVNNKFMASCEKCGHQWEEIYDFNMTSFFTNS
jgi:hypothetical protein